MLGAIIGDIVGSRFEGTNFKKFDFDLFNERCTFTDDTICTIATADWLLNEEQSVDSYISILRKWCRKYPQRGYGFMFKKWLCQQDPKPYSSFGNGSAMRVSPIGWRFNSLEETLKYAEMSACVSHNHPEGVKGAKAIASAIFLARTSSAKKEIKLYIEREFGYDLSRTCEQIRPTYSFDATCPGSVPEAILAFMDGENFEDVLRLAISLGGDSDTLACMAGGIAEAFYGINDSIRNEALTFLNDDIIEIYLRFREYCNCSE